MKRKTVIIAILSIALISLGYIVFQYLTGRPDNGVINKPDSGKISGNNSDTLTPGNTGIDATGEPTPAPATSEQGKEPSDTAEKQTNGEEVIGEQIDESSNNNDGGGEGMIHDVEKYHDKTNNIVAGGIAVKADDKVIFASAYIDIHDHSEVIMLDEKGEKTVIGNFQAKYLNYDGRYLYYCGTHKSVPFFSGRIYKYDLKAKESQIIFDGYARNLIYYDGYLYFTDETDRNSGILSRIKSDGSEIEILSDFKCRYINIFDGWIFYINNEDQIGRVSINGGRNEILYQYSYLPECLNIDNGYIYWVDWEDNDRIFRMGIDGSNPKELFSSHKIPVMIVQDNILYYLEWNEYHDTIINQINLVDGTSKRFKLPFTEGQIAIIDDWMYIYLTHPDSVDVGYTGRFNLRTEELEYLIEEKLVYQLADEL